MISYISSGLSFHNHAPVRRVDPVRSYQPDENLVYREMGRAESRVADQEREAVSTYSKAGQEFVEQKTRGVKPVAQELFQQFFKPYQKELTYLTSFYRSTAKSALPDMMKWESVKERASGTTEYMLDQYEMNSYCVISMKGIRCDYLG